MTEKFKISDIYDKNINFLIGSGASYGLFPTLALGIKKENGESLTIESLATIFSEGKDDLKYTFLFMHYYKTCIEPVLTLNLSDNQENQTKVLENYRRFVNTILSILHRRKNGERSCNIFTTNYDGCFSHTADNLLQSGNLEFNVNDGSRGFMRRYLQAKNFNSLISQTGVFGKYRNDVAQINLIHIHGSAYWYRDGDKILVDYSKGNNERKISSEIFDGLESFSNILMDSTKTLNDLPSPFMTDENKQSFWSNYEKLPIVNPTKWKFHETVFEEHYYQMLRFLSYELEKPNSILLTFGFSFADEHILNLIRRSLANPALQIFICCFNDVELRSMKNHFSTYQNVQYVTVDGILNFQTFNDEIFTTSQSPVASESIEEVENP